MIRKIGSILLGLSVIGIVSIGVNSSFTYQASHADFPAPQRPDLVQSVDVGKDYNSTTAEKHFKNERPSFKRVFLNALI